MRNYLISLVLFTVLDCDAQPKRWPNCEVGNDNLYRAGCRDGNAVWLPPIYGENIVEGLDSVEIEGIHYYQFRVRSPNLQEPNRAARIRDNDAPEWPTEEEVYRPVLKVRSNAK